MSQDATQNLGHSDLRGHVWIEGIWTLAKWGEDYQFSSWGVWTLPPMLPESKRYPFHTRLSDLQCRAVLQGRA